MNIYNNIIQNGPLLGTIQMSSAGDWINKTMTAPYNGILYSKEKEHTMDTNDSMGKSLMYYVG